MELCFFCFKQKTAYEMRISDWSSDVCSADLGSTTMHEAHAFLAERLPVPVINPGPLSYRLADAAIRLGLGHSKTTYPTPLAPRTAAVAAMGAAVRGR